MTVFFLPCGSAAVLQAGFRRATPAARLAHRADRQSVAALAMQALGAARQPGRGIHRGRIKTDGAAAPSGRLNDFRARIAGRMDSLDAVTFFEAAVILFEAAIVLTALTAAAVFMVDGAATPAELS